MIERIRVGTRTSRLALAQSQIVAELLKSLQPSRSVELVHFTTRGDQSLDQPLPQVGGKGLFTAELESALTRGDIDIAVHSLKDLPIAQNGDLTLGAIVRREDPHDCLVAQQGWTLQTLPTGAVIGTSSPRRQAQLHAYRPDLRVVSVRGNVETRMRKALEGGLDAVVLAYAGLRRLEITDFVTDVIPFDIMLPAPGQGALAVQCRADDVQILSLLAQIDHAQTRAATTAERQFLELMGGGCSAPIGAFTCWKEEGYYEVAVFASDRDGQPFVSRGLGPDPVQIAEHLAEEALAYFSGGHLHSDKPKGSHALPLAGRRIVVTRPEYQAQSLVDELAARGARVILAPAIRIEPVAEPSSIREAISRLGGYRWIVFTSVNAVAAFIDALDHAGLDSAVLADHAIAAVGPSTAQALSVAGMRCDFVPEQHTGADLAQGLDVKPGDKVLLPRSAIASQDLPAILSGRGAIVDDIAIYDTVPARLDESAVSALAHGVDMITFTSGSAVESFLASLREHAALDNMPKQCRIACIGPKTAEVLENMLRPPDVVADSQTVHGLVDAIVSYYADAQREIGETTG